VSYAYCREHRSYFCPCARPQLYALPFSRYGEAEAREWGVTKELVVPVFEPAAPAIPTGQLTPQWDERCHRSAHQRQDDAHRDGRTDAWFGPVRKPNYWESFDMDLLGCRSECAFSLVRGEIWTGELDRFPNESDVGSYECRGTYWPNGKLLFRPSSKRDVAHRDRPFVLVVFDRELNFKIPGWLYGWEIQQYPLTDLGHPERNSPVHAAPQDPLRTYAELV